eukprot:TRINITY_DN19954_c0_g1_i2.p2 TRINITY_DN19954_c0_g1~~TRINITY_DN19954_c0_g1_i2.p2  ORF type:complete len:108 (+),score=14.29 TRINITY_DN19954_c0_g1_i2:186-509(+)
MADRCLNLRVSPLQQRGRRRSAWGSAKQRPYQETCRHVRDIYGEELGQPTHYCVNDPKWSAWEHAHAMKGKEHAAAAAADVRQKGKEPFPNTVVFLTPQAYWQALHQ